MTLVNTALGLVNWSILLWNTPWTTGLCSCRIRYAYLDSRGRANATFTAMQGGLFPRPRHIQGLDLRCPLALLVGVSLAELASEAPSKICLDPEIYPGSKSSSLL
jgi:hypothetical protein